MTKEADSIVTKVQFTPDCQCGWGDKYILSLMKQKLGEVGIGLIDIQITRAYRHGPFTSCICEITPIMRSQFIKKKISLQRWDINIIS